MYCLPLGNATNYSHNIVQRKCFTFNRTMNEFPPRNCLLFCFLLLSIVPLHSVSFHFRCRETPEGAPPSIFNSILKFCRIASHRFHRTKYERGDVFDRAHIDSVNSTGGDERFVFANQRYRYATGERHRLFAFISSNNTKPKASEGRQKKEILLCI